MATGGATGLPRVPALYAVCYRDGGREDRLSTAGRDAHMPHRLTRHYVSVGGCQVHYRRAGSGPPVVVLHSTPRSSAGMLDVVAALAEEFTVFALDRPGYGQSDPLEGGPTAPSMADYADALMETLRALQIEHAVVLGRSTGALEAVELARRHPAMVAGLVLLNYPFVPTFYQDEGRSASEFLADFWPPIVPTWDGAHWLRLWAQLRDSGVYSPWFKRTNAARLQRRRMDGASAHAELMLWLSASAGYERAFGAVFSYDPEAALRGLSTPALFPFDMALPWAAQFRSVLGELGITEGVSDLPGEAAARDRALRAAVATFVQRRDSPGILEHPPPAGTPAREYSDLAGGQLHLRRSGGDGRPLVLIHDARRSSRSLLPLLRTLAGERPVIAPDLSGHGDSDALIAGAASIDDHAAALASLLDGLEVGEFDLCGVGLGAAVALQLARDRPRAGRLVLADYGLDTAAQRAESARRAPAAFTPVDDGSHLLAAWHFVRDSHLFWPWYEQSADGVRSAPLPDAAALHEETVDLFKLSAAADRLAFGAIAADAPDERVVSIAHPTLVLTRPEPRFEAFARAAQTRAGATVQPAEPTSAASLIAAFLRDDD